MKGRLKVLHVKYLWHAVTSKDLSFMKLAFSSSFSSQDLALSSLCFFSASWLSLSTVEKTTTLVFELQTVRRKFHCCDVHFLCVRACACVLLCVCAYACVCDEWRRWCGVASYAIHRSGCHLMFHILRYQNTLFLNYMNPASCSSGWKHTLIHKQITNNTQIMATLQSSMVTYTFHVKMFLCVVKIT